MAAPAWPGAHAWGPLYRVAGIAALMLVAFGAVALALYVVDAPPATGGEATLRFIAGHWAVPGVRAAPVAVVRRRRHRPPEAGRTQGW